MTTSYKRALLFLGAASILACTLLFARWLYGGREVYNFLPWNLFLAWLPLPAAALAAHPRSPLPVSLFFGALWLLFFPNAPYIFTDLIHLGKPGAPVWYDLLVILLFAFTGLLLGYLSLAQMHNLVLRRFGTRSGWLFVAAVLLLSSFGIYIGRFLQWNSWDLFANPIALGADMLALVQAGFKENPILPPGPSLAAELLTHPYLFTLVLAILLGAGYRILRPWLE